MPDSAAVSEIVVMNSSGVGVHKLFITVLLASRRRARPLWAQACGWQGVAKGGKGKEIDFGQKKMLQKKKSGAHAELGWDKAARSAMFYCAPCLRQPGVEARANPQISFKRGHAVY